MFMNMRKRLFCVWLAAALLIACVPAAAAASDSARLIADKGIKPSQAGALQVLEIEGISTLCDQNGAPIQLRGMSTHGLQWFPEIINDNAFAALSDDWDCNVVRLAMYVGENGYATDPDVKQKVIDGIELAKAHDMYAIVDWHVHAPGDPNAEVYAGAMDFFGEISDLYPDDPYILYELCNEPSTNNSGGAGVSNDRDGWLNVKSYAEPIIAMLRDKGNTNIIIVGNPNWSQRPDLCADDPIDDQNTVYALHFYSGTHLAADDSTDRTNVMSNARYAIEHGVAVFVSEWGTSEANGTGGPYLDKADDWIEFMNENNISWINWSLTNKNETSGIFIPYQSGKSEAASLDPGEDAAWSAEELSVSGEYVRARIKGIPYEPIDRTRYTKVLWDFDDGTTQGFAPNRDNPKEGVEVTNEHNRLKISGMGTSTDLTETNYWANLRISADTWGQTVYVQGAKELSMDVIAGEPTSVSVAAVPQGGATEWANPRKAAIVTPEDFTEQTDGTYRAVLTIIPDESPSMETLATDPEDNSFTNVILFVGADDQEFICLDNITISGVIEEIEVIHAEKGEAVLPSDFEDDTRQGFAWAADSGVKNALTIEEANGSKALSWQFAFPEEKPEDNWASAPRLDFWMDNLVLGDHTYVAFDLYVKRGSATTGALDINLAFQPESMGFWAQAPASYKIEWDALDTVEKTEDGLYRFPVEIPVNTIEGLQKNTLLRNMILIFADIESDFGGTMYVDNVRFGPDTAPAPSEDTAEDVVNDETGQNVDQSMPTAVYYILAIVVVLLIAAGTFVILRRSKKRNNGTAE